ncbi:hypothetical protein Pcinc_008605 [Petrolisthes cinctipes]|uniref:Uncharacterized protein n=1 Tax=Petrolisthes cinctipes TaxID=88211 RepID=A0AAE1G909_PETCI|nr:hypothetical protein Pcinc_008605 [Petrolisthes cinctipes]
MYNNIKSKRFSTKGHGLCGVALMDSWLLHKDDNDTSGRCFRDVFGPLCEEARMIATVANHHMCVYKDSPEENRENVSLLKKAMDQDTARLLCAVRHGDMLAKVPPVVSKEEDFEVLMLGKEEEEKGECGGVFLPNNLGLLVNVTGFSR